MYMHDENELNITTIEFSYLQYHTISSTYEIFTIFTI